MSAIWGMIRLDKQSVEDSIPSRMSSAMKKYKIDRYGEVLKKNVYVACGLQYITKESEREQLPMYDSIRKIYFTADCMIDNRDELIKRLGIEEESIPDGMLIYKAYCRWGKEFTDYVFGAFACVFYEVEKNEVLLLTDHTGSRSLHYCKYENTLIFSTIYDSILNVLPIEKRKLNERWLVACEAVPSVSMFLLGEQSPFESIKIAIAAHRVLVNNSRIDIECYWDPTKLRPEKHKSYNTYKAEFIQVFHDSIKALLRSNAETGMTLSCGLDSSSVACFAAPMLKEQNKKLYTFTSVPLKEYKSEYAAQIIVDESWGPKLLQKKYDNIETDFVDYSNRNAYDEIKYFVPYFEIPYKSAKNLIWLDEIYRHAVSKGCRVILKGQYGNATISYGKVLSEAYYYLQRFHLRQAIKVINQYSSITGSSRKAMLKTMFHEWIGRAQRGTNYLEDTYVKKTLVEKYKVNQLIRESEKKCGGEFIQKQSEWKRFVFDTNIFTQIGEYDTKFGLIHGIILRDPTKDKRLIEYCMKLPFDYFVQDGVERALVRRFLEDYVPDKIRMKIGYRGLQGADGTYRLRKVWDKILPDVMKDLGSDKLMHYMDKKKINELKEKLMNEPSEINYQLSGNMIALSSFSYFLEKYS